MNLDFTNIRAHPEFKDIYCKCGHSLRKVTNGLFGPITFFCNPITFFCDKCDSVYTIKLTKCRKDKISKEYLKQCKDSKGDNR